VFQPSFVAPEDALSLVHGVKPQYSNTVCTSQLFGGVSPMELNLKHCIIWDFFCQTCLVAEWGWRCISGLINVLEAPTVRYALQDPEDECTTILRNVRNCLPVDTSQHAIVGSSIVIGCGIVVYTPARQEISLVCDLMFSANDCEGCCRVVCDAV